MNNNRLYELFYGLKPSELKELAKYLRSPIFNRRDIVNALFDFMRKQKNKGWTNEMLFEHLYPKEKFDIQKLHYVHSFLLQRIESYLVWKETSENKIDYNLYLLKAFRKRNLEKSFNKTLRKLETELESNPLRNESYHSYLYEIQKEKFLHQREKGRTVEFNLQELSDTQDVAFMADKLKNACTILSHQAMMKKEYDKGLLNDILRNVELNNQYLNYPAIGIYYYSFKALSNLDDELSFRELKRLLLSDIEVFDWRGKRDIYILTANYCIRRLNSGSKAFIREAFEIYRQGLIKNVFIENGILSRWTYNNIIVLGLKLKEFEWVETFIYDYKKDLDEKTRADSFNFNLAKFYFEKKDYEKAMPLFIQTKYDDLLHNLGAKTMLSKMYYELSEWNALENLLESFKMYVSRKKDIAYHKENYMNIISFFIKMTKINPYDKEEIKELKAQIENTKILTEREWLLERVELLKKY